MTIGIGIIGCGFISDAYLRGAARSGHLSVLGVADIVPEAAAAKADAHGVAARPIDDLLADPAVEIVVNLTVPLAHAEVSTRILDAGKHVYTEKPLAATFSAASALVAHAAQAGLRVGCAPDTFFGAPHQAIRRAVDEGVIGRVVGGSVGFCNAGMESWHPAPDFLFKPGAGPVLDAGPYLATYLVNLLGPVRSVVAAGSRGRDRRTIATGPRRGEHIEVEVDTTVNAVLEFASGADVALTVSWDVPGTTRPPIEVYGETGTLSGPTPNWFGGEVRTTGGGGEWRDIDVSRFAFGEITGEARPGVIVADYRSIGIVDMALALRSGRPHRASGDLALHVLEVLEGILTAAAEGRRIEMATTCERPAPLPPGAGEEVLEG